MNILLKLFYHGLFFFFFPFLFLCYKFHVEKVYKYNSVSVLYLSLVSSRESLSKKGRKKNQWKLFLNVLDEFTWNKRKVSSYSKLYERIIILILFIPAKIEKN